MIALAVIYLIGACAIFAAVWRECARADAAEAEMERRMAESEAERRKVSGGGVSLRGTRRIP